MSNRATAINEPDLDAMKELTRLDAGYLTTAPIGRAFANSSLKNAGETMQYVASTAGMPRQPLRPRKVKHRMAGFVAFLGHVFGVNLEGRDIRPLFDICAQHIEPTSLTDNDLPDTPESLQKMLSRQRGSWLKHYKPDTNFLATVRALGGRAA